LNILEEIIDSLTLDNLKKFLGLFQNYFHETIDVDRGTDQEICPDISSPHINVRDVLIHVSRQLWPLPVPGRCQNPFCDAWVSSVDMETPLWRFHRVDDQEPHFLTEIHDHMAGLLGGKLTIRSTENSGSICPRCTASFRTSHLSLENLREHGLLIMEMHKRMGGFWTAMIIDTKENKCWPSLGRIFLPNEF
jgi:hypothetical protein